MKKVPSVFRLVAQSRVTGGLANRCIGKPACHGDERDRVAEFAGCWGRSSMISDMCVSGRAARLSPDLRPGGIWTAILALTPVESL